MILLYKDIKVEKENDESIDICDFERQMFQLSTKNIVTLEDYSGSDLNKIVITFDDLLNSKKEVFERVLEILRKYNYKFYVFICLSDVLNENECLSRSKLDEIVHSGGVIGWKGGGDIRLDLQSKDIITSEINVPVWLEKYTGRKKAVFCYKDGYIPRNQIKLIKDNFSCAVSIWQGNTYDPYMRNRVVVKATHDFSDDGVFFKTSDTNNLISVIVPVYNAERYLHDFFVSILNQTYKNLEIILVDDKSTDNSLEIIKHYSKIDNRLKIIENSKNLGVGRTIYNGMEKATGYFCSIMSPDDVIDLRYYEELINRYKETGSDVICGRLLISKNHYAYSDFQDITLITCESKLSAVFYFYPSLITRKLIVQFDIYNKSTTERHWEDIICRSKYAYYANHVSIANKAIRYYIIHDTSLSHKSKEVQLPYMEMAEEKNRHFFTSVGYPDLHIEIVDGFRIVGGWDLKLWYSKKESEKVEIKERKITKFIRLARDLLKLS